MDTVDAYRKVSIYRNDRVDTVDAYRKVSIYRNDRVYYKIATDLWAIGSDLKTCVDVCNALGVDDPNTMVVVSINEFYGRYDGALWQKIESWSRG